MYKEYEAKLKTPLGSVTVPFPSLKALRFQFVPEYIDKNTGEVVEVVPGERGIALALIQDENGTRLTGQAPKGIHHSRYFVTYSNETTKYDMQFTITCVNQHPLLFGKHLWSCVTNKVESELKGFYPGIPIVIKQENDAVLNLTTEKRGKQTVVTAVELTIPEADLEKFYIMIRY